MKQTDVLSDSEFDKFDRLAREVLSVSHEELNKREKQWQKRRRLAKKKRVKVSPACREAGDKD